MTTVMNLLTMKLTVLINEGGVREFGRLTTRLRPFVLKSLLHLSNFNFNDWIFAGVRNFFSAALQDVNGPIRGH